MHSGCGGGRIYDYSEIFFLICLSESKEAHYKLIIELYIAFFLYDTFSLYVLANSQSEIGIPNQTYGFWWLILN